jgi:hypothetical protein
MYTVRSAAHALEKKRRSGPRAYDGLRPGPRPRPPSANLALRGLQCISATPAAPLGRHAWVLALVLSLAIDIGAYSGNGGSMRKHASLKLKSAVMA